ncbi:MAG: AAC(3) family N-acetyltransferase [Polyangiaceae bacterium]
MTPRPPREPISISTLTGQLLSLGVVPGGVLLVHTSFSRVAPVEKGPLGLIEALLTALGPQGTLVMPSMSDDDDTPFDRATTPCLAMGVVADTFRTLPGVLRNDSPHAFGALGPHAPAITADQPMGLPHAPQSPVGRCHDLDAQILLLGVDHDADTTLHLAEAVAGVRYRAAKHFHYYREGIPTRHDYLETDHCCERFTLVNDWLESEGAQRRAQVGHALARLAPSRTIVRLATAHLRRDETLFLHPPGTDPECDAARESLASAT